MRYEIRFYIDSNFKDSKFYFVQPYSGFCPLFESDSSLAQTLIFTQKLMLY